MEKNDIIIDFNNKNHDNNRLKLRYIYNGLNKEDNNIYNNDIIRFETDDELINYWFNEICEINNKNELNNDLFHNINDKYNLILNTMNNVKEYDIKMYEINKKEKIEFKNLRKLISSFYQNLIINNNNNNNKEDNKENNKENIDERKSNNNNNNNKDNNNLSIFIKFWDTIKNSNIIYINDLINECYEIHQYFYNKLIKNIKKKLLYNLHLINFPKFEENIDINIDNNEILNEIKSIFSLLISLQLHKNISDLYFNQYININDDVDDNNNNNNNNNGIIETDYSKISKKSFHLNNLLPIDYIFEPIIERFQFHFESDNNETSRIDKPEWCFQFLINLIIYNKEFIIKYFQPILNSFTLGNLDIIKSKYSPNELSTSFSGTLEEKHDILIYFTQMILLLARRRISSILPIIHENNNLNLFCHIIEQCLLFDEKIYNILPLCPYSPATNSESLLTHKWLNWYTLTDIFVENENRFQRWIQIDFAYMDMHWREILKLDDNEKWRNLDPIIELFKDFNEINKFIDNDNNNKNNNNNKDDDDDDDDDDENNDNNFYPSLLAFEVTTLLSSIINRWKWISIESSRNHYIKSVFHPLINLFFYYAEDEIKKAKELKKIKNIELTMEYVNEYIYEKYTDNLIYS